MLSSNIIYAAVPVSFLVAVGLMRRWRSWSGSKSVNNTCLKGKTFLITGANCGIGLETAKALVKRKGQVIFACRDIAKAKECIEEIRKENPNGGEMIPMQLDLASFESIENFVKVVKADFDRIDVLINNAGVYMLLEDDRKTKEGFEIHFGVNHLGHFYLTNLLLDLVKKASPSRIVFVSSTIHEKGKIDFEDINLRKEIELSKKLGGTMNQTVGYSNSKLMNVYMARALAQKLKDSGVDVYACCPGLCATNAFRYTTRWYNYIIMVPMALFFMQSAQKGAETVVFCATDDTVEGKTGKFYRNCEEVTSKYKFNKDEEDKLWEISEKLVKARKPL